MSYNDSRLLEGNVKEISKSDLGEKHKGHYIFGTTVI